MSIKTFGEWLQLNEADGFHQPFEGFWDFIDQFGRSGAIHEKLHRLKLVKTNQFYKDFDEEKKKKIDIAIKALEPLAKRSKEEALMRDRSRRR